MGFVCRGVTTGLLAVALIACQRPAADSARRPDAPPPQTRDEWRARLMWPGECEEAFRASHAGDVGGINVVGLGSGVSLVEVTCAAGAYQPSTMRFRLTSGAGSASPGPLSFPIYTSGDGRELTLSQETEVWGDSVVDGAAAEITILSLARQTADCGVWARYSLAADQPRLLAAAARLQCPGTPGPPARAAAAGPPPGWTAIPGKD